MIWLFAEMYTSALFASVSRSTADLVQEQWYVGPVLLLVALAVVARITSAVTRGSRSRVATMSLLVIFASGALIYWAMPLQGTVLIAAGVALTVIQVMYDYGVMHRILQVKKEQVSSEK